MDRRRRRHSYEGAVRTWVATLVLVLFNPTSALADCKVVSAKDGIPVRITCGDLKMYAITLAQNTRNGKIEDALREAVDSLKTCNTQRLSLSAAQTRWAERDSYHEQRAVEDRALILDMTAELLRRYTIVELVVYVAGTGLLALGSGYVAGKVFD
jgi:hypothetical protein